LSMPAPPRRSTSARDITRSRVARPTAGFSGYTSRSLLFLDVASVCFKCFRCFICMLQVFHVDIAKVDRDVVVCCNGYTFLLQASVPNVSAVSDGCCTCFILVLHIFHTYVVSVLSGCCICFHTYVASVSSKCCICFAMATHVFS
jgi:hypothetical protein